MNPMRMVKIVLERTFALADGLFFAEQLLLYISEVLSIYAWILLNFVIIYEPSNEIWRNLTVEEDHIFLQKLRNFVEDREELVKEITSSTTISARLENAHAVIGNVDHIHYGDLKSHNLHGVHIFFDKAYSRCTKRQSGDRLEMILPDSIPIRDVKILINMFRDLASSSPLNSIPDTYFGPINPRTLRQHSFSDMQTELKSVAAPITGGVAGFFAFGALGLREGAGPAAFLGAVGAIIGGTVGASAAAYTRKEALKEAYQYFKLDEDSTAQKIVEKWQTKASDVHPKLGGNIRDFFQASVRIWLITKQRSLPSTEFH